MENMNNKVNEKAGVNLQMNAELRQKDSKFARRSLHIQ
jgi:hypothetical protein